MFALLINECDRSKREFVIEIALNFITFGSDYTFRYALACGEPDVAWVLHCSESVRPASKRVSVLNDVLDKSVHPRSCFLGTNRKGGGIIRVDNRVEVKQGDGSVLIDSPLDLMTPTSVLLARRTSHRPSLWMGWYREAGIDLVFVHEFRQAILAATGCCGCLFDEKLQLWLVETGKLALYELGTRRVKVTYVDGREEEETSGAGS